MPLTTNHQPQTCRIAILGPECTGKTELARGLALHYNTLWVPEYSREYLSRLGRKYDYDDILAIAQGQLKLEQRLLPEANKMLFADTELLVNKIWSDDKFGKCHAWILEQIDRHPYDLYLLCNTDLPWEYDPMRENPDDRDRIFDLYLRELESRDFNYGIVSGSGDERLKNGVQIVDNFTVNFPDSTVN